MGGNRVGNHEPMKTPPCNWRISLHVYTKKRKENDVGQQAVHTQLLRLLRPNRQHEAAEWLHTKAVHDLY